MNKFVVGLWRNNWSLAKRCFSIDQYRNPYNSCWVVIRKITDSEMKEYFRIVNEGATIEELTRIKNRFGSSLPTIYCQFLMETNGAEWAIHDQSTTGDCLRLWSTVDLLECNEDYQIQRWLPQTIAIGTDSGDDAILFDKSISSNPELWPVVRVGFGNLDAIDFVIQATSFSEWVQNEFRLKSPSSIQ